MEPAGDGEGGTSADCVISTSSPLTLAFLMRDRKGITNVGEMAQGWDVDRRKEVDRRRVVDRKREMNWRREANRKMQTSRKRQMYWKRQMNSERVFVLVVEASEVAQYWWDSMVGFWSSGGSASESGDSN